MATDGIVSAIPRLPVWIRFAPALSLPSRNPSPPASISISLSPPCIDLGRRPTQPSPFAVDSATAVVLAPLELVQENHHNPLCPFRAPNRVETDCMLAIDIVFFAYIVFVHHRLPLLRSTSGLLDLTSELLTPRLTLLPSTTTLLTTNPLP
ncbi:uncharacterized protein LOC123397637 isoform X2 [Hordeum vulgare subsp. vulgare]|uniref:uncharacterized protein LOC123397637 isoform X2 n=1 Tax=Hordeum vulgare subsp. vulgare TaxID=112509 RepID=UPI001D1A525E|nr:uncharacterized protein LOC123397637 isoform X2 [Hordeum vulgare subsp. vulgare]